MRPTLLTLTSGRWLPPTARAPLWDSQTNNKQRLSAFYIIHVSWMVFDPRLLSHHFLIPYLVNSSRAAMLALDSSSYETILYD